jgi:hypothetical protein
MANNSTRALDYYEAIREMSEGFIVEFIGSSDVPAVPSKKTKFAMFRGVIFAKHIDETWDMNSIIFDPSFRYRSTGEKVDQRQWPIQTHKISLQEIYDYLEECSFVDGVPGVGMWIRDKIQENYGVKLAFDPAVEEEW